MRTTIKDIAKKAFVSTATVSLVINGNSRISSETQKRVKKAIKDLGYYPSRSARDLVSRKSGNIGFILTDDHFLRTEPFYTQIFLGTEFEARQHPYYVLLATIPTQFTEKDHLPRFILERSVDGLIIAGKVSKIFLQHIEIYNLPVVFVDYHSSDFNSSSVLIDNLNGAIQATEYLLQLNHTKIAFIGGDLEHPSVRDRFGGFKLTMERKGLFNKDLVLLSETVTSRESGYHAAKTIHEKGIEYTALFACNDAMANGAMQYYKENGIKIPKDLSIIGFDNIEDDLFQDPPLSTMSVPKIDMGVEALQLILEKLTKKSSGHKKILIPVELIVRGSTKRIEN